MQCRVVQFGVCSRVLYCAVSRCRRTNTPGVSHCACTGMCPPIVTVRTAVAVAVADAVADADEHAEADAHACAKLEKM